MKSEREFIDFFDMIYVNSNQKNDELTEFDQFRIKHTDNSIDFFMEFWRLASSIRHIGPKAIGKPFKLLQYKFLRRLFRRLREYQVYVNTKFNNLESFRNYYIRLNNN